MGESYRSLEPSAEDRLDGPRVIHEDTSEDDSLLDS